MLMSDVLPIQEIDVQLKEVTYNRGFSAHPQLPEALHSRLESRTTYSFTIPGATVSSSGQQYLALGKGGGRGWSRERHCFRGDPELMKEAAAVSNLIGGRKPPNWLDRGDGGGERANRDKGCHRRQVGLRRGDKSDKAVVFAPHLPFIPVFLTSLGAVPGAPREGPRSPLRRGCWRHKRRAPSGTRQYWVKGAR
ncbi:hypothetical protein CEXT_365991 [Caerostris extrusa]|uniref:Uncharacterized protein n=1 Tax=Caerostris extrusa TaxID=172846 RepID=A0AAV4TIL0_CAEEX|nr:hypothetical protein CEXT_365991 [Caerostris extrusa]